MGRFTELRWVETTASTNADIAAAARAGQPEGLVIAADYQTAGRGRRGRRWEAPPEASLLVSVLLRPPTELAGLVTGALALAARAGVGRSLGDAAGREAGVKWPNDLVARDRKLAGVLAEATADGPRMAVAAGIGINCNWSRVAIPEVEGIALDELAGGPVDRRTLLDAILAELDRRYTALLADGGASLVDELRRHTVTLGRSVSVESPAGVTTGQAVELTDAGELVVEQPDGKRLTFAAGDVVHLR